MPPKINTATKRLLHELRQYTQEPNAEALDSLGPVAAGRDGTEDLLRWEAVLKGVRGSAYEGGRWKLSIKIPEEYPLAPPDVRFVTPICHANVHFKTGEICLDLLKTSWSPAYSIAQTVVAIHQLLTDPEPDSPLNVDVAALLRGGDVAAADALVRFYTREYRWEG
ncbi:MAG: hypothetical protein M4579_002288 [Chaenotheca gracillima]|nr:MAG: hypothetical protein M4579_002288 [Chaenotheca gracillima]